VNVTKTPAEYHSYPEDSAIHYQFNPPEKIYDTSTDHIYWVCKQLADNVDKNYKKLMPLVRKTWDVVEKKEADKTEQLEKEAMDPDNSHPENTYKKLAAYSLHMAESTYKTAQKLVKKTARKAE
jgi:dipeptidase